MIPINSIFRLEKSKTGALSPARCQYETKQHKAHIFRVLYGYPSVHGAFFFNRKSYGPVRCGFKKAAILRWGSVRFLDIVNPMVRCGAVMYPTVRFGSILKNRKSYGPVRCDFEQ